MGEWKTSMTVRIDDSLRKEIYAFAEKEMRSPAAIAAVAIELGFVRLKEIGSVVALKEHARRALEGRKSPRAINSGI